MASSQASTSATQASSSESSEPPPPPPPAQHAHTASTSQPDETGNSTSKAQPASSSKKARTTYNTFLSPSGSTSFFTSSWFERRPVKSDGTAASSTSASASSSKQKRRPTYEEYRCQEPPQARLIRLRGLFDVLMDKDQRDALADGRAKDAWTATARRARYGAGGKLARGSLAREMQLDREMDGKEKALDADRASTTSSSSSSSSASSSSPSSSSHGPSSEVKEPPPPNPPRQSYANELLAQCRQCKLESDKDRARRTSSSTREDLTTSNDTSGSWSQKLWPFSKSDEAQANDQSSDTSASSSISSIWTTIAGSVTSSDSPAPQQDGEEFEADYDGESGYAGSGVWGLSAVKHGSRHREKERRLREEAEGTATDPKASATAAAKATAKAANPPKPGQEETAEEGTKRMMIEWEGFIKYAEAKERGKNHQNQSEKTAP